MFQTHCYDAWLSPEARKTNFFMYSQLGGTLPAPLFLFLAGISFALVTAKLHRKGLAPAQIARTTIRRGAEILALGLAFRLQEFLIAWGWAPWSDLLRVDILNTIGVSMMLMGVLCWLVSQAAPQRISALPLAAAATSLAISLLTPLLWTVWRPDWLPWPVESYINGVHNLGEPQAWLFPVFPWSAFAFAGLAVGFLLQSDWARTHETAIFLSAAPVGWLLIEFARWLDAHGSADLSRLRFLAHEPELLSDSRGDFADDSFGELCMVPLGAGDNGIQPSDPVRADFFACLLGTHRVCLRASVDFARSTRRAIASASYGLLTIILMMLALSLARTKTKGQWSELWTRLRQTAQAT